MSRCDKCYAIDAIVDGQVLRKMKYSKHFTKVNSEWRYYNNLPVRNSQEIARLDGLANAGSEVDCVWYDDRSQFMRGFVHHQGVTNIPATKHTVVCDWSPSSGEEATLSMLNRHALDGDDFYIIIKNVSSNSAKLTVPSAHVWGKTVTVNPGENISVKATYAGNTWYFENLHDVPVVPEIPDIPGQGEAPDPDAEPINPDTGVDVEDADILVVRFYWGSEDGRDLDTMTELVNTGISEVDGKGIGWSGPGNNIDAVTSIIHWAGDNTSSGNECIYINLRSFINDHPIDVDFIDLDVYATWFGSKGEGKFKMYVKAYKGGTMTQNGYNFVNEGGQKVYSGYLDTYTNTIKGVDTYNSGGYDKIARISFKKDLSSIIIRSIR